MVPMARALAGEVFHDYRLMLRGASGDQSVMSFSGAPVMADDTAIEGSVVIFRDITTNQRLEQAKDEFLAVTAHELRSPLAAVRGYAEMLLRREQQRTQHDDNSRDVRGLTILSQQVSHMLNMVDNLLDVSRLDAGQLDLQLERINLVSLVSQVLDQQRPVATEHELQLATDHSELWVECDAMRVHQVLTNLVNNAAKYSAPGSPICVQLATRPGAHSDDEQVQTDSDQGAFEHQPFVRVAHAYEAVLSVTDNGPGIPSDQQQRLFQRFYRSSGRSVEGLGLGLYLSREFVHLHGGRIWVESTEGQGSTFAFTLPMREG
jgi:two-component system phosphate regulon sensor histidine kinase PhoR